jgi:collagen type VII alpha
MPPTLRQATGTGSNTWTIEDSTTNTARYLTTLVLDNQGQIFANATNNFLAQTATTNWTVTGTPDAANVGNQFFQNDGSINIIGTSSAGGATTANFTGNINVIGNGQINLYGNAVLNVGSGVGISSGETINFITANGNTNGSVTEVSALFDSAVFQGFLPGDTVTLQGLGGTVTSESVVDGNGERTVYVTVGGQVVDAVTFDGNFTNCSADFVFSGTGTPAS